MKKTIGSFNKYVASAISANLADGVSSICWVWTATLLTRDPFLISLVAAARTIPWCIVALPAGAIADRINRKVLMAMADAARSLLFFGFAVLLFVFKPTLVATSNELIAPGLFAALICGVFLIGVAEVLRDNANQSILPLLVHQQDLERANGRLFSYEITSDAVVGPILGSFAIALFLPLPFILNAALYLVAMLLVLSLRPKSQYITRDKTGFLDDIKKGWDAFRQIQGLMALSALTAGWNFIFYMITTSIVLYAQEIAKLTAPAFGLLLGIGALGGVISGLISAPVINRFGRLRAAQFVFFLPVPPLLLIAISSGTFWMIAMQLAVFMGAGPIWNTVSVSYRQRTVPDYLLGRVVSIHRMIGLGIIPFGILSGGLIVHGLEPIYGREIALRSPFLLGAICACLLGMVAYQKLKTAKIFDP